MIYTGKGDKGMTGLKDGTVVAKSDPRICLLGDLEELNSHLGVIRSLTQDLVQASEYVSVQKTILKMCHAISGEQSAETPVIFERDALTVMEQWIEVLEKTLIDIPEEVLPGGCLYSAQIDVAKAVARRCERSLAAADLRLGEYAPAYLNRLSDYLYLTARMADARMQGVPLQAQVAEVVVQTAKMEPAAIKEELPMEPIWLDAEEMQAKLKSLSAAVNKSYGTFYTFCICDPDGQQIATNSLAMHSVQVHGALAAAQDALKRARRDAGCVQPEKGSAPIYSNGQLVGSIGVYGSNDKANNQKVTEALDLIGRS